MKILPFLWPFCQPPAKRISRGAGFCGFPKEKDFTTAPANSDIEDIGMGKSFQEQLLELGLVDKKKMNAAKKQQHQKKKAKTSRQGHGDTVEANRQLVREAEEKKKARVRQLNRERDAKLRKRADLAQIKQLVEQNRIDKDEDGIAYRFKVAGKIQRIFVSCDTADKLSDGRLGIVLLADSVEVVPRAIVEKIRRIDGAVTVIVNENKDENSDPDDPYAKYKIPDDLIW
ncbi:MAG: nucleoprotein/polynucleotide-associated enzyme [Deltaproteobacteria bacterium]|nr:MAG: nucleoprotein/polynucleotide-associated enzyme [Deltaproteobacteria bacterium]